MIYLDLKPPYLVEFVAKLYPLGYVTYSFKKIQLQRCNTREHVVHCLDFMGPYTDIRICA